MSNHKNRQRRFTPRGENTYYALYLIGLLGFATVRQLCVTVWEHERSTNDNLNRLLESHYLHPAHEATELAQGRGNRIVFLTRTGLNWVLAKGHLREQDIAYYWRGEGHWHPLYDEHNVLMHDVLCAFIRRANEDHAIDIRLDPYLPVEQPDTPMTARSPLQDSTLLPDRIFAVSFADQVVECYLELDCGTEDKRQWQEKVQKYVLCPEVMDQEGVVVFVVATSKRRMETLINWSRGIVDHRFWFSHTERVCYQYSRAGKDLVLQQPGDPFGAIWCTVTDQSIHSLFRPE